MSRRETQNKAGTMDACTAILRVSGLCKAFGNNKVLVDFNLQLRKGENIVVLGRSGSGKSVLIKCIIGLLIPDSGSIQIFGKNISAMSGDNLDILRTKVGFLFQSNALYDSMTVRENLEFAIRRHAKRFSQPDIDDQVLSVLADVGLAHTQNMMPEELSGGMKKRIALARVLILKPEIILYDEPTTGLDSVTGKEIIQLMKAIQQKYETASLIISHDPNVVKKVGDRIAILLDGRCYVCASYNELMQSNDPHIKQFFE